MVRASHALDQGRGELTAAGTSEPAGAGILDQMIPTRASAECVANPASKRLRTGRVTFVPRVSDVHVAAIANNVVASPIWEPTTGSSRAGKLDSEQPIHFAVLAVSQ